MNVHNSEYATLYKKCHLDVTFCILYFSSNSCSTCFGQPCAHHQELTTAWCYSLVLVRPLDALPTNRTWPPSCSHGTYQHKAVTSRSRQLLMMGTWLPETCWAAIRREEYKKWHLVGFSYPHGITMHGHPHIRFKKCHVETCKESYFSNYNIFTAQWKVLSS